jgi:hypothetical protein
MAALPSEINLNNVAYSRTNLVIPWKGKTFNQITSLIQMNTRGAPGQKNFNEFLRALPIKLPRREIVTNNIKIRCDSRVSASINVFDMPGGSIINSSVTTNNNGLVNTMDNTLPNNGCEDPGTCLPFVSPAESAKRRVRSAGMIRREFDISRGNDVKYFVNKNQYLNSRNRTFHQNQYNYIRQGNATVKPGDPLSSQNLYSTQGLNHCPVYFLPTDVSFQYQWTDALYYQVDVSSGYYGVDEINNILHLTMEKNTHYFIDRGNKTKEFTIYFAFNGSLNKIELHTAQINNSIFNTSTYTKPYEDGWDPTVYPPAINLQHLVSWPLPTVLQSVIPAVVINNNVFTIATGFSAGSYPTIPIPTNPITGPAQNLNLVDNVFLSQYTPGIQPVYTRVSYKPSNSQFASQGGVSASSAIARARYNAITNNTAYYNNAYGLSVANALAYGVPENGYTIKDKLGYPLRSTPRFPPLSTVMQCETCNTWDAQSSTKAN